MTKTVYKYNGTAFTLDDSDRSPSGRWNIPAGMTDVEPPDAKDGYTLSFDGAAWQYIEIPQEEPAPEPTLDEVKESKKNELKTQRDTLEVEPIEYNGNTYDYDSKARERIAAAIIALELSGGSIAWTLADNTSTDVTAQDLKMVVAAIAARSNTLHVAYRVAAEKVTAAETADEVNKITLEV